MEDLSLSGWTVGVIVIILLVLIFNKQLAYWISATKHTLVSVITGKTCGHFRECMCGNMPDDDDMGIKEHAVAGPPIAPKSDVLNELGYVGEQPWDEVLKASELDASTQQNHRDFVKDVRRFSSGANFTSTNDENHNWSFTQFVGLRRPNHVHIGKDARQQPDVNQTVLQRNKPFVFNYTDYSQSY